MSEMKLYHKDVCMPRWFRKPTQRIRLLYTRHALEEARTDELGPIDLPKTLTLRRMDVIEIGVVAGRVVKILVRGRHRDEDRDLCAVLIPIPGDEWVVVTVWTNHRTYHHHNLDRSRYVQPSALAAA